MHQLKLSAIDKAIGYNLALLRGAAGLSQSGLGIRTYDGISSQQISKYELGENQISARRLIEFSGILQCPLMDFFDGVSVVMKKEANTLASDLKAIPEPLQASVRVLTKAMVMHLGKKLTRVR